MLDDRICPRHRAAISSSDDPVGRAPGRPAGPGEHTSEDKASGLRVGPAALRRGGAFLVEGGHATNRYGRTLASRPGIGAERRSRDNPGTLETVGACLALAVILFAVLTELPLQWAAQVFLGVAP